MTRIFITIVYIQYYKNYITTVAENLNVQIYLSDYFNLHYGVPQGSCLGPLLFTICSSKLLQIIWKNLPNVHAYSDDTQLYIAFSTKDAVGRLRATEAIERCIDDIRTWMLTDKLKINDDKTEFMIIGTRQQLSKISPCHLEPLGILSPLRSLLLGILGRG